MSNFNAFDTNHIAALIQPYEANMAAHITPIKFEALTPDIFAFLFRTTGKNHEPHFFVSLEYDYISDIDEGKRLIEEWHGNVINFWTPETSEDDDVRIKVDKIYSAVLAEVEPPRGSGYWSENIIILNEESVEKAIDAVPEASKAHVRDGLKKIYNEHPDAVISLYINDDKIEYFYN